MIRAGLRFGEALKEAQANGYAEQDPTADIEGHDACRKICILASLAFGRHVYPAQAPTEGISGVALADVAYAESCGRKIKLLGRAIRGTDGKVRAYVAPHLVDRENPLAGVEDVFNAIAVQGQRHRRRDVLRPGRGQAAHRLRRGGRRDRRGQAPGREEADVLGRAAGTIRRCRPTGWRAAGTSGRTGVQAAEAAFPDSTRLSRPGAPADEFALITPTHDPGCPGGPADGYDARLHVPGAGLSA